MCAVIRRGILGGFSNKIGNIVGTSWKGIAVMKSLPLSVANPRTTGQVNQRNSFGNASKAGSILLSTIIKPLWDRFAQQESGFNEWLKLNITNFDANGIVVDAIIAISQGKMTAPNVTGIVYDISAKTVTFTWNTALPDAYAAASDLVYIAVGEFETMNLKGYATGVARSVGTATVSFTIADNTANLFGCIAFKRVDGTVVSDTAEAPATTTP